MGPAAPAPPLPRRALAGPGFQAGPGPPPAQVRPRSSAEPATVFIDLRPPEPPHQGSWESSSPRDSSSSGEEEKEEEEGEPADCLEPASPSAQGLR
ncbi:hypothetical protein J0S82_010389 [Galemys pyrenaicus]|uniref:Dynein axonemal assembly factor 8 n=1 Tax=Galemys pyrenaicus TaxID=202257 RepID=A0A8J5ZUC7_GALPY|nr:hypothetical protein J0S82_010389 [Galemys pyrenaicus]